LPSITDWLTAIGTVGAVVVALLLAFLGKLTDWYRKPILTLEFENKEPFCRHSTIADLPNQPIGYFLRLRVRNTGKSMARDCEAKLIRILDVNKQERTNFDPTNLHWTGHGRNNKISIHKTAYEYLDVAYARNDIPQITLYTNETTPRGFPFAISRDDCILQIVLFGINTKPKEGYFKLHAGDFATKYDDISIKKVKM
jgi:hypothetical protein